jgi:Holliday junction resolvasome RuvABC endonuclease subunit
MMRHKPRLLALHCGSGGFGYAVFEGQAIYDWGTVTARGDKNAMCLRKLSRLLERFSPEALILEEASETSGRAERIVLLHNAIAAVCRSRNTDLYHYSPADIQRCFGSVGARTRHEVAEAVVRELDVLSPRLPRQRKAWQSEPRRMAIFSAAALALTHLSSSR